jgi:CHAD domain-containing protein
VRDLDVLTELLRKAASNLDEPEVRALSPLFVELEARHKRAAEALDNGLEGDRYRGLLTALQGGIENPALTDEAGMSCRTVLPPKAIAAWRRLKKGARGLRPGDPDEEFHEVRKRAKRARYTAELVAPVLCRRAAKGARRFIRLTTQVQDALGQHQDAVIAGHEIEGLIAQHADDPDFVRAAGRLVEIQRDEARAGLMAFFDVWEKLDQKKRRRWMAIASKAKS